MDDKNSHYFKLGITIALGLSAAVVVYFLISRYEGILTGFNIILSALQPVIVGAVLAYLLCPIAKFFERHLGHGKISRFSRPLSTFLTVLLAFAVIALFCAMVLPQLTESAIGLVMGLPDMVKAQLERLDSYLKADSEAAAVMLEMVESVENFLTDWIKNHLLSTISTLSNSVLSIGSMIINLVVAVIVAIYLILDRERYLAQCRKLFFSVSKNERVNTVVMETLAQVNQIFGGFISGKLLDSLIVGVICFVFLTVVQMPYALLISVIVGVTNIIPMFGPFIGAIPSAFLLLLVSPGKCLVFLIFIIILQQIDGNIIGPRILGNSTGLSALYVTVAMLLFGKLMGFLGMIIGVPLFATLYYIVKRLAESSLRKQEKPVETAAYVLKEEVPEKKGGKADGTKKDTP